MEASRKKYNIYKIHIDGIYFITLASLNFLKIQTKAGSQQGRIGIASNFNYYYIYIYNYCICNYTMH
jgi:hypothetical protein